MSILKRAQEPTSKFFRTLRNIGIALVAASGAILTAPISLPAVLVSAAGYLAVAGSVLSAVSQITTEKDADTDQ